MLFIVLVAAVLSTVAGEILLTGKTTQVMVTVGVTGGIVLMMDADVSLPRMVVSLFSVVFGVVVAVL